MNGHREDPFRVAIVGGGIGGLVAALELHHHCQDDNVAIDVYEQASQYAEIGAGVGLGVNAARLLHHLGIGDEVNAIAGHRNGIWISFRRYDTGADIVTVPVDDNQKIRQVPVHRADFLDILLKTVKQRGAATLHTKKICRDVVDNPDGTVSISFADKTTATANLAVGCDGIHSVMRGLHTTDAPVYSGRIAYRGLVPIAALQDWWPLQSYSASWLCRDRHFLTFPVSSNTTLNIVAFVNVPENELGSLKESWTSQGSREDCLRDFAGFEQTVQRVIREMPEQVSKWVLNDREPLSQWVWRGGKVVLMGDAAHAMLPFQGAGAGQAIEDGHILARCVHEYLTSKEKAPVDGESGGSLQVNGTEHSGNGDLERWMLLYQAARLPRAQKAQRTAREAGQVYDMDAPGMQGKSFDECMPIVADRLRDRMKWVWGEDVDAAYAGKKKEMGLASEGI